MKSSALRGFEAILYDRSFQKDVAFFREKSDAPVEAFASTLVVNYELKTWIKPVVIHYLLTGEVDGSLEREPVTVLERRFWEPLRLELAPDITQPDLKEYITRNWSKEIKPHLNGLEAKRTKVPLHPEKYQKVYDEYLNKKKTGKSNRSIAFEHNISESTLSRIVRVKKKT